MSWFTSCAFWRQRSGAAPWLIVGKGQRAHALLYSRACLDLLPHCDAAQSASVQTTHVAVRESLASLWSLQ